MYPKVQLLIDGKWCDAASGRTLPVVNPATGETIGAFAHAEKADLDRALEAAKKGFDVWRKTGVFARYQTMRKAAELLRARADAIAPLMTMEQGKPLAEAKMEVLAGADVIDWFAEEGRRAYGRIIPARAPGIYQLAIKEPVGPVAAFTPWNFPINQIVRKLSAALATGCSIIVKAPEETPASPAELLRAFARRRRARRRDRPGVRRAGRNLAVPHPEPGHPQGDVHRIHRRRQAARGARRTAHEAGDDGTGRPRAGDRVRGRRRRFGRQDCSPSASSATPGRSACRRPASWCRKSVYEKLRRANSPSMPRR